MPDQRSAVTAFMVVVHSRLMSSRRICLHKNTIMNTVGWQSVEEVRPSHVRMRCKCILDERLKQYLLAMSSGVGLGCCCCGWTTGVQVKLEVPFRQAHIPSLPIRRVASHQNCCIRRRRTHAKQAAARSLQRESDCRTCVAKLIARHKATNIAVSMTVDLDMALQIYD